MIDFQRMDLARKEEYDRCFRHCGKGCEYGFVNLYLWGRQKAAFVNDYLVLFSQFHRRSVYPFPVGTGPLKPVLDAIIQDARERGIPCCLSSMSQEDCRALEELYPGAFRFYPDRDSFDYVYDINDLADLKGRKFQRKRNHLNRFRDAHPDCTAQALTAENLPAAREMIDRWFADRLREDPHSDFHLEQLAISRALANMDKLALEGLLLVEHGQILAVTLGSALCDTVFDIHFEKARMDVDGAYAAINCEFARYLRSRYPNLRYLDREDDMGMEGLRKAKLSYNPAYMVEKYWARLWENDDEK